MKRGPYNTPHSRSVPLAIAEARRRYLKTGDHHSVVQHIDRLSVMLSRLQDAFRPLWSTHDDNRQTGIHRPNAKLTIDDIPVIAQLRLEGLTVAEIAEKFEVHSNTIGRAMKGKSWGCIPRIPVLYNRRTQ